MFVMHFVGPSDCQYIGIIAPGKPFKPLMYDHIVNQEIGKPIRHYSKPDRLQPKSRLHCTKQYTGKTWYSEDYKEPIVLFKKASRLLMMIFMKIPEPAMHNIFMSSPGNTFHNQKSSNQYSYVNQPMQIQLIFNYFAFQSLFFSCFH